MFELTREVRLVLPTREDVAIGAAVNGHAGFPNLDEFGSFVTVQITLAGEPNPTSGYLVNIKEIDSVVRSVGLDFLFRSTRIERTGCGMMAKGLYIMLLPYWSNLARVRVGLSPYTSVECVKNMESLMVTLSRKYEFSAAHRLHNPELSERVNEAMFGKCNNPHGHGHNYELEVTVGDPVSMDKLDQIVAEKVIQKLDHKYLNIETPEFAELNPTVENIAMTIHRLLKDNLTESGIQLSAVTVWETPKTSCRYSE
jgi:6-pyruvoyltetrahydropterin/6-carboxytetrahydropterin synthase